MTVTTEEFLRRFLLHVLPHGFVRIRFFGFLANRRRKLLLPLYQQLLMIVPPAGPPDTVRPDSSSSARWRCPRCGGPMLLIERLSDQQTCLVSGEGRNRIDSS
jgi:hypothetical protein